jgi:hypothetical protein
VPRVYCIPDPDSRVAAVLERRPRQWWRVGRWDLYGGEYTGGAWFRGSLYPQRCDLSPGGRWLLYFALKSGSDWPAGETYTAISRLPWLKALAAWKEAGTWSRGAQFTPPGRWEVGEPTVGDVSRLRLFAGVHWTQPAQFAVERRRGWSESADTPPRGPNDMWDERRAVVMEKARPGSGPPLLLSVRGMYEAFRELPDHWPPLDTPYHLHRKRSTEELPGVQWADWTFQGHLATATAGVLKIHDVVRDRTIREVELPQDEPQRCPPPAWASEW